MISQSIITLLKLDVPLNGGTTLCNADMFSAASLFVGTCILSDSRDDKFEETNRSKHSKEPA